MALKSIHHLARDGGSTTKSLLLTNIWVFTNTWVFRQEPEGRSVVVTIMACGQVKLIGPRNTFSVSVLADFFCQHFSPFQLLWQEGGKPEALGMWSNLL